MLFVYEKVMSYICEYVMSHMCGCGRVKGMNKSWHTSSQGTPIWMRHVSSMNESWLTIMSKVWMSHVTRVNESVQININESRLKYEWVMARCHVACKNNKSGHTSAWVMVHIWRQWRGRRYESYTHESNISLLSHVYSSTFTCVFLICSPSQLPSYICVLHVSSPT